MKYGNPSRRQLPYLGKTLQEMLSYVVGFRARPLRPRPRPYSEPFPRARYFCSTIYIPSEVTICNC